jgi:lipoprotein
MKKIVLMLSILFLTFSCSQKQGEKINQKETNS